MEANAYQSLALRSMNPESGMEDLLLEGVLGLNGEAGEVVELLKKHRFQGHAFEREHMARELGDVAWYLALCAHALNYSLEDIFRMNLEKSKTRYPQGFDCEKSIHRSPIDI